jgi:hypothetical protein
MALTEIFSSLQKNGTASTLDHIHIGQDEIVFIPFTLMADEVDLHFLKDTDVNAYVLCNGPGCAACASGSNRIGRLLFPVFDPVEGSVRVLPVPSSKSPHSLLPQLQREISGGNRVAVFVNRIDNQKFKVTSAPLAEDARDGAPEIAEFLKNFEAGGIDLGSAYPRIENAAMACIPSIERKLALKGIKVAAA